LIPKHNKRKYETWNSLPQVGILKMGIISGMELKSQIENDIKDAMRSKDETRKRTLRMALSAIKLAEIEKGGPLDDQGVYSVLQKEIKSRHESIADAERAGRSDLIAEAQPEIAILEGYLPQAFSQEELEDLARQAILEAGATSPQQMGQVMKLLMPRLQGRASGNEASQAVKKLLVNQ
jgi:uncharacterized protein YqeY